MLVSFARTAALVLAVGTALGPAMAHAETSTSQCQVRLADLDDARTTLLELQEVVGTTRNERAGLMRRNEAIRAELVAPALTDERDAALRAELARIYERLDAILVFLPPIETQAEALATQVDAAERSYIQCIESSIDAPATRG